MAKKKCKKPGLKEVTTAQTVTVSYGNKVLIKTSTVSGTYTQLRVVRKDPTVVLGRTILISCLQAGSWNIEADEDVADGVVDSLQHLMALREDFIYNAVAHGRVDFGWQGFEKLFAIKDNRLMVESLKVLLHDITTILVDDKGHFNGYRQRGLLNAGEPVDVPVEKCLHIAFDVEGQNYYGVPLLENIRAAQDDWAVCNDGAKRYDAKVAGTNIQVSYPPGTGTYNGEVVNNSVIGAAIFDGVQSSGSVLIPTTTAEVLQELNTNAVSDLYKFDVKLLEDKGKKQADFKDRLKYLDSLKVRGLLLPERALLEGQYGTKAEAGEHIGMAITNIQELDKALVRMMNEQVVNQLVCLNFGEEVVGKVRLVATPLVDKQIGFMRTMYKELSKTDRDIDLEAVKNQLDIPILENGSVQETKEVDNNEE